MDSGSSVTQWLAGLKAGELAAAEALWNRYASSLAALARRKLRQVPTSVADEDDVTQSVFHNICRGAVAGRFENIKTRDELWWLLLSITKHKVVSYVRRETAAKRGAGRVLSESALTTSIAPGSPFSFDALVSNDPTPEFLVTLQEETHRLLGLLRDDRLREIATARIEGHTVSEIADRLAICTRSVERKLRLIRNSWAAELNAGD